MTNVRTRAEIIAELNEMKTRIDEILEQLGIEKNKAPDEIEDCLKKLRISPRYKGFEYLKIITKIRIKNPKITLQEAYAEIASPLNGTIYSIERNIRYAIQKGLVYADDNTIRKILGNIYLEERKITNSQFINALCSYLLS